MTKTYLLFSSLVQKAKSWQCKTGSNCLRPLQRRSHSATEVHRGKKGYAMHGFSGGFALTALAIVTFSSIGASGTFFAGLLANTLIAIIVPTWIGYVLIIVTETRKELATLRRLCGNANPLKVFSEVGNNQLPVDSDSQKQLITHLLHLQHNYKKNGLKDLEKQTTTAVKKLYSIQQDLGIYVSKDGWLDLDNSVSQIRLTPYDFFRIARIFSMYR